MIILLNVSSAIVQKKSMIKFAYDEDASLNDTYTPIMINKKMMSITILTNLLSINPAFLYICFFILIQYCIYLILIQNLKRKCNLTRQVLL